MSMLLPKNLPMFKRFMNLELLLPKYQQNLFLELYNTGIEKKKLLEIITLSLLLEMFVLY